MSPLSTKPVSGFSDLTVIVAGVRRSKEDAHVGLEIMRAALPAATFILSTSREEARSLGNVSQFDKVLIQDDPGLMASDKFDGGAVDINQVRSYVLAALAETKSELAIVLRPGASLSSAKAVELWQGWASLENKEPQSGRSRILVSKFFTINPIYDERLPFQIATRLQLGRAEDLFTFWLGPEYPFDIATWYESRPHAAGSKRRERSFRARFTPDQWMTLHYLYPDGRFPIAFHNDVSPSILTELEEQLSARFIVVHPRDIDYHDIDLEEYFLNTYLGFLCYSYWEWSELASRRQPEVINFPTYRNWPRLSWQRQVFLFARRKIPRKLLRALCIIPEKLLRQVYS